MSTDSDLDRNEAATPHKLSEAHKRGQVARSTEVVSALVFAAAVVYLHARGAEFLIRLFALDRGLLSQANAVAADDGTAVWRLFEAAVEQGLSLLAPLLLLLMAAGILANLAQTRGVFSLHPVSPDWSRLNPVTGLQRVLSMRTLYDTLRAVAKLMVLATVAYLSLRSLVPHFHQLSAATPASFISTMLADAASAALKIAAALAVIAVADLAFTQREFGRKMRMSRREVRDEAKQRDGDPRIRSRLRELRREALKRSLAVHRTRNAQVVITNPTHYAVALSYRHGQMAAPQIVAKGAGILAAAMRKVAHRHGVPVVVRPSLARALYAQVDIDDALPESFYRDVAQLMIWVIATQRSNDRPTVVSA